MTRDEFGRPEPRAVSAHRLPLVTELPLPTPTVEPDDFLDPDARSPAVHEQQSATSSERSTLATRRDRRDA